MLQSCWKNLRGGVMVLSWLGGDSIVATNPDKRRSLTLVIPSPECPCFESICMSARSYNSALDKDAHQRDFRFMQMRHTPHRIQALESFDISDCLSGPLSYRLTAGFGPLRGCVDCPLQNTRKILESSPLYPSTYDVPLSHQIPPYVSQRSSGGRKRTWFPPIRVPSLSFCSL